MVYFCYTLGTFLLLLTARGIWMHRQARKKIREYFHERNERVLDMHSTMVFGPHYNSMWEAAKALILHYRVKLQASDGTESDHMFTIDFVPLIGSFRGLHPWGDDVPEEESTPAGQ
jgi:hypothetical protein